MAPSRLQGIIRTNNDLVSWRIYTPFGFTELTINQQNSSRTTVSNMDDDHIEAETRWTSFFRWHFQMHLLEWKYIPIKIWLFVPSVPIDSITPLVQIMAWCRPGYKPLSEPMMASLPTHICGTRSQFENLKIMYSRQECCLLKPFQNSIEVS